MKELWKDIEGFEGLYQISNYGRVKSLERERHFGNRIRLIPERILTPDKKKVGIYFTTYILVVESKKIFMLIDLLRKLSFQILLGRKM